MRRRLLRAVFLGLGLSALLLVALGIFLRRPSLGRANLMLGEDRTSPDQLWRHVRTLTTELLPRSGEDPESLERAAAYVEAQLRAATPRVESQVFTAGGSSYRNVVASFGPPTVNGARIVVGAHYDAFGLFGPNPGADDNASGTAGLLELARLLAAAELPRRVELVAFALEEPPFFGTPLMGSRVYAEALKAAGVEVEAMLCLEMIGYYSDRQPWPSALFALLYPHRGDFVGVVGLPFDGGLARRVKGWMRLPAGVPVYSFNGPAMMGTDLSDHSSFWLAGLPAVMVTDTAFMRNPHYHAPSDTAETLDYRRMALVVDGVLNATLHLARARSSARDGRPPAGGRAL